MAHTPRPRRPRKAPHGRPSGGRDSKHAEGERSNSERRGRSHGASQGPRPFTSKPGTSKPSASKPRDTTRVPSVAVSRDDLLARVLHRDALIIVINKPAGIPVHAGPGGGPNLEELFDVLRFGLPRPPSLAHRLDRDTSGCLVLGRHPKALRKAGAMFAAGRARKTYWAVVEGVPKKSEGLITHALRKATPGKGWKMVTTSPGHPHGQEAITAYKVRGTAVTPHGTRSWIECEPKTGRTHQIRVHLAEIGCPIVGDPVYGRASSPTAGNDTPEPLHLHARAISLPLSPSRPPIVVTAPVPDHMRAALAACGYEEKKS
ncbi:MAG: RNA pseudouridine synthase [Rhodospirillaceae bacterium]|nr:MAG: RNA pseudouridine synthase [Rhodospirillaceae bacterium]